MKNSYQWIDAIIAKLFSAEERRLDKRMEALNTSNNIARGKTSYGFIHMGKTYIPKSVQQLSRVNKRSTALAPVAFSLLDEARSFTTDHTMVENDKQEIRQLLFKMLHVCNDTQEVRNSLPDAIVNLFPELSQLKRTLVDPCYYVQLDPRTVALYHRLVPKIEMYAMGHLLY